MGVEIAIGANRFARKRGDVPSRVSTKPKVIWYRGRAKELLDNLVFIRHGEFNTDAHAVDCHTQSTLAYPVSHIFF